MKTDQKSEIPTLRQQAEEKLQNRTSPNDIPRSEFETERLLHELQVHQIELEMQNDELRSARTETEAAVARYTDLYDFAPAGYFTLNRQGEIMQTNLAGAGLLDMERTLLVGKRFAAFVAEGDRSTFNGFLHLVFSTDYDRDCIVKLDRKDQPPIVLQITASLLVDGDGCRLAVSDITDRKVVENALRESENRLRSVFRAAPTGIGVVVNRVLKEVNERMCAMVGYSQEELVNQTARILYPTEEDFEFVGREKYRQICDHGTGTLETRWKRKDGQLIDVLLSSTPLEQNDMSQGVTFTALDITERKRVEEALRESETRFRALHNATFGGIAIHDRGIILECNRGLSETTGYSIEELEGMDGLLLIAEQTRKVVESNISSGYEKSYEVIGVRRNGEEYPLLLEGRNIPYKGKDVRVVEFRDITKQRELESQLQQSQKMESVGRLAGGVAHDFNNKLQIIMSYTEMALDSVEPASNIYEDLNEIRQAAKQSADLTRQLLTFARKQTISPKILDLNASIENMLKMLRRLIGENTDLLWNPAGDLWPVKMDPTQIDQILANLCVNARDAIDGIGSITIKTQNTALDDTHCKGSTDAPPGNYLMLSISDNGCGMDKELLEHIFEPFFTSKALYKGTGLGLATIYGIVKQNSGIITVDSAPGKGTAFKIYLPRCMEKKNENPKDRAKKPPMQGRETILLVEDEPALLNLAKRLLETLGYTVLLANLPSTALRLAKEYSGKIDVLVTDVIMPETNGPELAAQLKLLRPNLKCLFMSGYTADAMGSDNFLPENVHFIQKPFEIEAMAAKLRAVLVDD